MSVHLKVLHNLVHILNSNASLMNKSVCTNLNFNMAVFRLLLYFCQEIITPGIVGRLK